MDQVKTAPIQPAAAAPDASAPEEALKYSSATLHPVQKIEKEAVMTERMTRRKLKAAVYGSALPMREMMHEHMLSQCQRLPGLPSSYLGLESLTGRDETIEFQDFLNLPFDAPDTPREDPRDTLELLLNIKSASTL